ncbi:anti-sigma factor family protein [Amycolatopsis magusensis]|uniref:anti-sigma factor family protein n=1 Tax=Amycolatopsis magusensis TaxID=882444 RepID=UPI003C2DACFE
MNTGHDAQLLGAYALGALDEREVRAVEEHVAACTRCADELDELRQLHDALGEVPPEALLDGPPDGGDLLLQRTLRQVRTERGGQERKRRFAVGVAAAVVAAAFLGGGVIVGQQSAPDAPEVVALPPGTKTSAGTDPGTGASMTATVKPAAGWVRISTDIKGIPAGQKCRIMVVGKDGTRAEAGSWLVSPAGERDGTKLDGAALVPPDQVAAVEVENFDGKTFVSVPV